MIAAAPASNRKRKAPKFDDALAGGPGGVDTICLRGAVHPSALEALPHQEFHRDLDVSTGELAERPVGSNALLPSGVHLTVDRARPRHAEAEARFEVSIPRMLRDHNLYPASCDTVLAVVGIIYEECSRYIRWRCPVTKLSVMRLDLPYDFSSSSHGGLLLRGLADLPVARTQAPITYMRTDGEGVQSLYRKTDRWLVRAYDKSSDLAVLKDVVSLPDHLLRIEVQLRAQACRRSGIYTLNDLAKADLAKLHLEYFEKTRMGAQVGGGSRRVRDAYEQMRYRKGGTGQFEALLGFLAREAHGMPANRSPGTLQKYRSLARDFSLLPSDVVEPSLEAMRLDYASGRLLSGDDALS